MKKTTLKAAGLALAFGLFAYPAFAQDDAKKPVEPPADKCTMTIKADIGLEGENTTTLTLTPEHKGALYSWRVTSGGTITAGQGTTSVLIANPPPGEDLKVEVKALKRPSCPAETNKASITVKLPAPK